MPLLAYLWKVGAALLLLLFVADYCLPRAPIPEQTPVDRPAIRIHSDRKWPERIVFDTTLPTIVPVPAAIAEGRAVDPIAVTDAAAKKREREAFALMQSSDVRRLQPSDPGRREVKPQRPRKVAKRHVRARSVLVWRQPQFGWFGNTIW